MKITSLEKKGYEKKVYKYVDEKLFFIACFIPMKYSKSYLN